MYYYKVESSHWNNLLEFKSKLPLTEGQCFKIKSHDGSNYYPTRFKVKRVSETPEFKGTIVEILEVDTEVDSF